MHQFDEVTVMFFSSLRQHCGGLIFYQIFSKLLSEVFKCWGMSGIAFEADSLIFTVSGMTSSGRHFGFLSK